MIDGTRLDLRIDVTGETGLAGSLETAVSVFAPATERLSPERSPSEIASPPIVAFAFPGGGYSRGYFDIRHTGVSGYSQAEHHVQRGMIFVACEPLGVGDSSQPDTYTLTFENVAAANHATVQAAMRKLAAGTLVDELPPLVDAVAIGMGQSMGGCLLVVQQARHNTFAGIAVLGFSAIHTKIPAKPGSPPYPIPVVARGTDPRVMSYLSIEPPPIEATRYSYFFEDVVAELVAADLASGHPVRRGEIPSWASATKPACSLTMMSPGAIADEAAAISVPVLLAMGERDVCPDPHSEPSAYSSATDIELLVVPRMAHMHNFASTREILWDRIVAFAGRVGARVSPAPSAP